MKSELCIPGLDKRSSNFHIWNMININIINEQNISFVKQLSMIKFNSILKIIYHFWDIYINLVITVIKLKLTWVSFALFNIDLLGY